MRVSIVIVSWNTKDLLKKCLQSLFVEHDNIEKEVFVVDNNSQDGTVNMVARDFSQVTLMANNYNAGFAKANNQALELATGDYVLLLNPDTELLPGAIKKSVEFMLANPLCGVMGPKMYFPDHSFQSSVRRFPTLSAILMMLLKLPKFFKHLPAIDRYLAVDFDYTKTQECDQVMGAYMFMPKKLLTEIGLLDERFFIWFEEVDFCRRTKKAGYMVMYDPEVEIIHVGGQSFAQQKTVKKQKVFFQSASRYFLKHGFKKI
ncbi:MAG: glycosyltransferase family 2 protein [bacterium]